MDDGGDTARWTKPGPYHNEGDAHIVTIQGVDYAYTAYEKHAWDSWCLLVAATRSNTP